MKINGLAVKAAGATSLALLLTTSAFADQTYRRDDNRGTYRNRDDRGTYSRDNNNYNRDNRSYRENEHVNLSGRITSFSRENNGYRVHLDRGPAFWVPESYYRRHSSNWRIGVNISLGGIFRGGSIIVDDGGYYPPYPAGAYDNGYLSGVVDRVDYRRGIAFLRDDRSGRIIEADLRTDRYGRLNIDDLRPGDFVELSGDWVRGDIFAVARVDSVRTGRYGRY
jgi:hypothetical protein